LRHPFLNYLPQYDESLTRQVRVLEISPEVFVEFCQREDTTRRYTVINPIPDDARMVGGEYDPFRRVFRMLITSETFEEVEPPHVPPLLSPQPSIRIEYLGDGK
jgi:hypothetical protein